MIITPDNPLFWNTLHAQLPPGWENYNRVDGEVAFVVDGESGLMRPANRKETIEYLYGGEYDLVEPDDFEDEC